MALPPRLVLEVFRVGFAIALLIGILRVVNRDFAGAVIWLGIAVVFFIAAFRRER